MVIHKGSTAPMKRSFLLLLLMSIASISGRGENNVERVRKVVAHSTLELRSGEPFHLKATVAPSLDRDKDSKRNGTVEIWWASSDRWRRELIAPGLHLVEVMNGAGYGQNTEGDYLPEWLREISVALVQPVPDLDKTLTAIRAAEVRKVFSSTHYSWMEFSTDGVTRKAMGAGVTINDNSNLLSYGSGFGWSFDGENYGKFHNRLIARTVKSGGPGPEVTAIVTLLEDLDMTRQDLFETVHPDKNNRALKTVLVEESMLRSHLIPLAAPIWPSLKDGPLEGAFTTEVLVDREGKVREIGSFVSDNPGLEAASRDYIMSMRFQPYMDGSMATQMYSRLTFSFHTTRPAGVESFDSARTFLDRGMRSGSPAGGINKTAYVLKATFDAGTPKGVARGTYTDTWLSDTVWCREAQMDDSRVSRCRNGNTWYRLAAGSYAGLMQLVLKSVEPVPALDTFVESDWRISRKDVDGQSMIRVATGAESDDGVLAAQSRGFWFDANGVLQRAHFLGFDARYMQFEDFNGSKVPHQIDLLLNGQLGMRIKVASLEPKQGLTAGEFKIPGHEWKRQFTDETR